MTDRLPEPVRLCPGCGELRPISMWPKDSSKDSGLDSFCKVCRSRKAHTRVLKKRGINVQDTSKISGAKLLSVNSIKKSTIDKGDKSMEESYDKGPLQISAMGSGSSEDAYRTSNMWRICEGISDDNLAKMTNGALGIMIHDAMQRRDDLLKGFSLMSGNDACKVHLSSIDLEKLLNITKLCEALGVD
jgi:hypothetical protein